MVKKFADLKVFFGNGISVVSKNSIISKFLFKLYQLIWLKYKNWIFNELIYLFLIVNITRANKTYN